MVASRNQVDAGWKRRGKLLHSVSVCALIAEVFLLVGLFTPAWVHVRVNNGSRRIGIGIVFTQDCDDNGCVMRMYSHSRLDKYILEYRIEAGFSTLSGIVSVVLTLLSKRYDACYKLLAAAASLTSGVTAALVCARIPSEGNPVYEKISSLLLPYSMFLFAFGGSTMFVLSIVMFVNVILQMPRRKNTRTENNVSRLAAYPEFPLPRQEQPAVTYSNRLINERSRLGKRRNLDTMTQARDVQNLERASYVSGSENYSYVPFVVNLDFEPVNRSKNSTC